MLIQPLRVHTETSPELVNISKHHAIFKFLKVFIPLETTQRNKVHVNQVLLRNQMSLESE